ncbi:MAG: class II aldolase/adducin family protein [Eubacteriales bacterium]|nr:class II aldolase/adducin family protein [Eubacteriales bacterium]
MNALQQKYKSQIEEMIEACQRSAELGYGAGSGGNAAYRVDDNVVLITPTGIVKRKIRFEDICMIDLDGNPLYIPEGRKPTGEAFMHLHIMKVRPDVKATMHAHPPLLIGMSLTEEGAEVMSKAVLPDAATFLGPILTIPYVRPNGDELGYSFDPYIMRSNAFIMGNHGCLVCSHTGIGDTVDACQVMEAHAKAALTCRIFEDHIRELNDHNMKGMDKLLKQRGAVMPCPPGRYSTMSDMFADIRTT